MNAMHTILVDKYMTCVYYSEGQIGDVFQKIYLYIQQYYL